MIIAQKTWLADPSADPSWVSLFRVEPESYPPIISTAQLQYNGAMQAHKQNSQAEINRGEYRNFSRICDLLFCLILPFVLPLYGMTCVFMDCTVKIWKWEWGWTYNYLSILIYHICIKQSQASLFSMWILALCIAAYWCTVYKELISLTSHQVAVPQKLGHLAPEVGGCNCACTLPKFPPAQNFLRFPSNFLQWNLLKGHWPTFLVFGYMCFF